MIEGRVRSFFGATVECPTFSGEWLVNERIWLLFWLGLICIIILSNKRFANISWKLFKMALLKKQHISSPIASPLRVSLANLLARLDTK